MKLSEDYEKHLRLYSRLLQKPQDGGNIWTFLAVFSFFHCFFTLQDPCVSVLQKLSSTKSKSFQRLHSVYVYWREHSCEAYIIWLLERYSVFRFAREFTDFVFLFILCVYLVFWNQCPQQAHNSSLFITAFYPAAISSK